MGRHEYGTAKMHTIMHHHDTSRGEWTEKNDLFGGVEFVNLH